jgi:hypothetical protein
MAVRTATRRKQRRYSIERDRNAIVAFEYPCPSGRPYRLPLLNVSKAGLSFALDDRDELTTLDPGTRIEDVVVRIGDCEIDGEMVLMHLTPDDQSKALCGALFFPSSDDDLIKLRSLVAGMEAVAAD